MKAVAQINNPGKWVVLPHYAFAALSFLVLNVLLLFSTDAFAGHYFHPKLLTLTHVAVLGWATMLMFGALYQLLPVILEVPLYSEKLAKVTFALLGSGTILLAYAFWTFSVGAALQAAAVLLLLAFLLFNINLYGTARSTKKWAIEADFIVTSGIWLFLTGVVGLLMAINFRYPFLPESHLHYLKLHAHIGMAGWFLLLIVGVGSKLLPMFLLTHHLPVKKLSASYYLINLGLLLFVIDQLFLHTAYQAIYGVVTGAGIVAFGWYVKEAYQKRVRRLQDAGMQQSLVAVALMVLPVVLVVVVSGLVPIPEKLQLHLNLVYGISVFMGFITALILGQTFKTLPFIIWMHRYQHLVGLVPTPQPKDLYSEQMVQLQNFTYLIGFAGLLAGVVTAQEELLVTGGGLLLLTAVLYVFNVFKMLWLAVK
ncbi:MAG: cytochrome c oxidase subunit I [Hymenobacteraceae bacterium]|nr:cytochrome c oxidase subunit I [Hymenobacteraceae bacterium]MDX5396448.1 cytochrome c oxidase subunit I [Hymenobacteraceae bacterium]MDX5442570.1 cytochrome c oxidase subunit I [Hymenobacteraceae bacterium]MDX5512509.1 cytochrome c oxidase subunit I [Hymenobacteraceae bacterium]